MKFLESKYINELVDATSNMYRLGWDERNGGNISYLIEEEDIDQFDDIKNTIRDFPMFFEIDPIVRGKYFLVTGTGKYFKNVIKNPLNNLGLVKIDLKENIAHLVWGFCDGGTFTSEFPTHLMSHAARLKVNPNNRVIIHSHPTYTICMGAICPVDDIEFTRRLWKSNTEAVVVFPEGVGVLPCMLCGTTEIGLATSKKMESFRLVNWTNHGIYGSGNDMDEAFGLIETVEKTAQIYMLTKNDNPHLIPDEVIIGLIKLWNLKPLDGVIKENKD